MSEEKIEVSEEKIFSYISQLEIALSPVPLNWNEMRIIFFGRGLPEKIPTNLWYIHVCLSGY